NTLFSAPAETVSAEQQRKGTNFNALAADVSQRAANFRQKLSPVSEVNKKPVQAATTNLSTSQQGAGGDLAPGVHVQHERFGSGIVKAIEGAGDNRKAIVQFETFGEKTLLLRFARLVIV
ncbi:MAG: hypothetical protein ACRCZQ_00560, partial [Bacteroidales bacterium]